MAKVLLLPGMDGTGELFAGFVAALAEGIEAEIVGYPRDACLTYADLAELVRSRVPVAEPFVLVAESFSTPVAIRIAAENPENLKGLVLCAGFVRSPVRGLVRAALWWMAPVLFRLTLPKFVIRFLLVGWDGPDSLVEKVTIAVSSVRPKVLSARLREVLDCDVRLELGGVSVPILYLQGGNDRLLSERCVREILQIQQEMALVSMDGPHLLMQRAPGQCAEALVRFLQ